MKFMINSLLVALCVMSATATFANTSLQIQDQPNIFQGVGGADSIFEQYRQMQEEMASQIFNDPFFRRTPCPKSGSYKMIFSDNYPQAKFADTKEAYVLTFVIPGMPKENISVTLTKQTLTVSGKSSKKTEKKDKSSSSEEQVSKQFSQVVNVPDDVVTSKITSKYENGVLTVTLPKDTKKVEENTKTIKVE